VLEKAIAKKKKVSFNFIEYGTDKKPYIIQKNGQDKEYIVSPYRLVVTNGRYYLLCAFDHGEQYHFRVELIRNIELLEDPARPRREVKDQNKELSRFMAEHIYMYSGGSVKARLRAKKDTVSSIIDWFGTDVDFSEETEDSVTVKVDVNEQAMVYWALQYGMSVEVLGPPSLRKSVADAVQGMWGKYNKGEE
jgi:predicted DNA-binding transcriptional regulator YafY